LVRWFAGAQVLRVRKIRWFGTHGATGRVMGVRSFDELDAWQLANELKLGVYALTESGSVTRDFKFREQLRDAAASGPRNIAEGFGRYKPPQFRQFLDVAIASLMETSNHLRDGVDRKHFTPQDIAPLLPLTKRATGAALGLKSHLKDAKPPTSEPANLRRPPGLLVRALKERRRRASALAQVPLLFAAYRDRVESHADSVDPPLRTRPTR
jgi:four helix bundle protein